MRTPDGVPVIRRRSELRICRSCRRRYVSIVEWDRKVPVLGKCGGCVARDIEDEYDALTPLVRRIRLFRGDPVEVG
jgi:hypothetical protein